MSKSIIIDKDLQKIETKDLISKLGDLKKELFNLRFQKSRGELKNICRLLLVRRAIARVMTELNRKRLGE